MHWSICIYVFQIMTKCKVALQDQLLNHITQNTFEAKLVDGKQCDQYANTLVTSVNVVKIEAFDQKIINQFTGKIIGSFKAIMKCRYT